MLALDLIKRLISRAPKAEELRGHIKRLDQEKASMRYDQRRLEQQRAMLFERAKRARQRGDQSQVVFHLQEMKALEHQTRLMTGELSRINKSLLVLGHYMRRLDRLEHHGDSASVTRLIERLRGSDALRRLDEDTLSDELFNEVLTDELATIDADLGITSAEGMPEDLKGMLDSIDAVIDAERDGDETTLKRLRESLSLAPLPNTLEPGQVDLDADLTPPEKTTKVEEKQ